ncbi:MAG: GNAT family N-acetyltransferase [Oscillospiraceae bacterium]|jgi:ribosomal protein S18 acetylase RimI-like enzyme|nr:GNAT family N-acetyltransferase [Oscillospiraceae bacterium]
MKSLFEQLAGKGFRQTSLSVQKENPALRLYERLGYKTIDAFDAALWFLL